MLTKWLSDARTGLKSLPGALVELLRSLPRFFPALLDLLRTLCRVLRGQRLHRDRGNPCLELPPDVYKRADPLLYSQEYLMKQGLAVTWDNPDIQIYRGGVPVPSGNLAPDTEYDVEVRVWNGSYDAPAVGVGVALEQLSFGVGTQTLAVGTAAVDVGVKGGVQHPAFAHMPWRTPTTPGHYCLRVALSWPDDANPNNNVGQENTQVGTLSSPATFEFTVRNTATIQRRFAIEVSAYRLPGPRPCEDEKYPHKAQERDEGLSRLKETRRRWAATLGEQAYGNFPVPEGWAVNVVPQHFSLAGGAEASVTAEIEYLAGEFTGRQPFNVHVFSEGPGDRRLEGGVTLVVEG